MAEYRDVEKLRKQIAEFKEITEQFANRDPLKDYISGIDAVMKIIDSLPEAVQCKECEKYRGDHCAMHFSCECGIDCSWNRSIDFCSWGKRKEYGENG